MNFYIILMILIIVLCGAAMLQIYDSVESVSKLRQINFQQTLTWQKIGQRIQFIIGTRENRKESDYLIHSIQKDLGALLRQSDEEARSFENTLKNSSRLRHLLFGGQAEDERLLALYVNPELIARAIEVRDAPVATVRTNFDYWPIPTTIGIQSNSYIEPLFERHERLSELRVRGQKLLHQGSMLVIVFSSLGILLIWLHFLRPTIKALHQGEENLRITLNSIADAVVATDSNNNIVRMNPEACRLSGWPPEQAIAKNINEVFKLVDAKTRRRIIISSDALEAEPRTRYDSLLLLSKSGSEYFVDESSSPLETPHGETVGTVWVFRDITERRLLNHKLVQNEKLQSIGLLAGGIAHDFNNILSGIQGSIDLLRRFEFSDEKKQSFAEQADRLIARGAGLTQQLTFFARGKELYFEQVDIEVLMQDSIAMVKNTTDRRIRFEFHSSAENSIINGNDGMLQGVIINILLNGIDAMAGNKDGGTISIAVSNVTPTEALPDKLIPGQEYVRIDIRDTGYGISEENLGKIFDPFFTTKEVGEGTGLGLTASYGTIRDHKGTISVASKINEGTVFSIYLPSLKTDTTSGSAEALRTRDTGAEKIVKPNSTPESVTILFVDDEEALRTNAYKFLTDLKYRVLLAGNGKECVDLFKQHQDEIDVIFLDMNMPIKNGADVIRELESILGSTRIIVCTGYPGEQTNLDLIGEKIDNVIQKPYTMKRLLEELTK